DWSPFFFASQNAAIGQRRQSGDAGVQIVAPSSINDSFRSPGDECCVARAASRLFARVNAERCVPRAALPLAARADAGRTSHVDETSSRAIAHSFSFISPLRQSPLIKNMRES